MYSFPDISRCKARVSEWIGKRFVGHFLVCFQTVISFIYCQHFWFKHNNACYIDISILLFTLWLPMVCPDRQICPLIAV